MKSSFPDTICVILTTGETAEIPVTWDCSDSYGEENQPFYIFWAVWDQSAWPLGDAFNLQKMPYIEVNLEPSAAATDSSGSASSYTTDAENTELCSGVQNILKRAYQQVDIAWTPLQHVNGYSYGGSTYTAVYEPGVTYYGLPYGMIVNSGAYVPQTASFDTFLTAVSTPGSLFYTSRGSYNGRSSTYYATDCSTFASYSYGITRMTTYGFASSPYFQTIDRIEDAQPGDCLNNTRLHIILITNIIRDAEGDIAYYELSEETPPKARTILRSKAYVEDLVTNGGYVLKRYTDAGNVPSPDGYAGYVEPTVINGSKVSLSYDSTDYDGEPKEPAVTVTLGNNTLQEGTDYTVSYQDNIQPGQALVKVSGAGSYGGTAYALFSITNPCPFDDVTPGKYYYEPVLWAYRQQITAGITDTVFGPDRSCTRAQMVTFLWRAAGRPEPELAETPFTDVDKNAYYYTAVLWACENGITKGTSETTFDPTQNVNRAQVVCFLQRLACSTDAGENDEEITIPFTDVPQDTYYYRAVCWAYAHNVTNGVTDTQFAPNDNCTRAQIITLLRRYENLTLS